MLISIVVVINLCFWNAFLTIIEINISFIVVQTYNLYWNKYHFLTTNYLKRSDFYFNSGYNVATSIEITPTIEIIISLVGVISILVAINIWLWNAFLTTIEINISLVNIKSIVAAARWPKYCRYGVKLHIINQSIIIL